MSSTTIKDTASMNNTADQSERRDYTIAVDTGGTFTNLVVADQDRVIGLYKSSTTPDDLFRGVSDALGVAAEAQGLEVRDLLADTSVFAYATTHSTNAILQEKVAKTAFITSRGHADVLLYKEGGKDQVHNWAMPFPKPYIPRRLTFELTERVLADGAVAVPLDEDEVRRTAERLRELEVEAVGVCLLWSVLSPEHELRVAEILTEMLPGVEISLSHQVNRVIREYRRASATVIDASLKPLMRRHLSDMDERLRELGFNGEPLMVTHVSGGVLHLDQIIERPLQTIDSGPALAPIAGIYYDQAEPDVNREDVLVVDTGGTSFDASLILDGRVAYTREKWIGQRWYGHMTGLPAVETRSIGAGGGSIAFVDAGGLLHVGPESAGADPGPVAYGRGGTEPTVTDAAVALGYIDPANFLGGRMSLDLEGARNAIAEKLGKPLGLSVEDAAAAVMVVASEEMRGLLTDMTVAQGRDARECLMVAGGGAAGLNIAQIAREAGVRQVLIPKLAAGLSAVGGQYTDITALFARGHFVLSSEFDYEGTNRALDEINGDMDEFLDEVRHPGERTRRFRCEARYDQQLWEIEVDMGERDSFGGPEDVAWLQEQFDAAHMNLFAVNQPGSPLEIITWLGEARVVRPKPSLETSDAKNGAAAGAAEPSGTREAYFDGAARQTPVYRGDQLGAGARIEGPAIIEEETTTIVVLPSCTAIVKPTHYLLEIGEAA